MVTIEEARRNAAAREAKRNPPASEKTLRDYFAAEALQGELACQRNEYEWHSVEKLAEHCYNIADAMLKARGA